MNKPIGNQLYGPLMLRTSLGMYLVIAGFMKLDNLRSFISEVQGLHVLPDNIAAVYAVLLPYFEVFAGGLLVLGMWTTLGAIIASLHFATMVYVFGLFTSTGALLNKDVILLAAGVSILYSGAGAFSVDRFRESG
ncbi:MAG: DoxX family protein [Bdellovibrionales bacterium]|nr:DoxX family protein [Bdellovibrionales bacterium]